MIKDLLKKYDEELALYYQTYEENLTIILYNPISKPRGKELHRYLKSQAGALGARIGKAGQRAKREFVFHELLKAKENGADLTFHKVQHIGQATAGSRFINKEVVKNFSSPGRTARIEDRSKMTQEQTQSLIEQIAPQVDILNEALEQIRNKKNEAFKQSLTYKSLQKEIAYLLAQR